ncbi:receptor-transporting protein 3 [Molossus nigricans]
MPAAGDQDLKVWQKVFEELIHEVKPWHHWTLTADESLAPNILQPGWTQYQQWGFARFSCSWCSRSWASAHVQTLFHMHWSKRDSKGQVKMRIFAQRCQKCVQPPFEVPEFTEENISRTLNNLVFRILKKCYREGFKSMEEISAIKDISLEGPHDTHNCEACLQGFCAQSGFDLAKPSPTSPSLPTISIYKSSHTWVSTTVGDMTGDTRVKKEKVSSNPSFPEPPQAKSSRTNTNPGVERVSSNPSFPETPKAKNSRANTNPGVERVSSNPSSPEPPKAKSPNPGVERVSSNPSFPVPPKAKSPRANTQPRAETVSSKPWFPEPPKAKSPNPRVERVSSNPSFPQPPKAKSPRANTHPRAETVSSKPWFPERPQAKSPRANTNPRAESIVQISFPEEGYFSHTAPNCTHCNLSRCCCCFIILLLITVVVVIVVKITG